MPWPNRRKRKSWAARITTAGRMRCNALECKGIRMSNRPRSPFGSFNLVLLLLCVTCCGCADSAEVVAYLLLKDSASSSLSSSLWPDRPADELRVFIATQCTLLESEYVLNSALSRRKIRELDLVIEHDHSEAWLFYFWPDFTKPKHHTTFVLIDNPNASYPGKADDE